MWLVAAALAAVALAAAAIAAGRGEDDDDYRARIACLESKRAFARYVVVADAYERGELGPRAQVVASVHPKARRVVLEPDGDLRRWNAMSRIGKHEFLQWATSGEVYDRTRDEQTRAVDAITREDCE